MKATALVRYDAMCRAIDAAYKVDEVKSIRDTAIALEMYSRQAHNIENERQACLIRLRAEKKAGVLSKKLERSNPGSRKKDLGSAVPLKSEVLRAAGISKDQAKKWEQLAGVPDDLFEQHLADRTHIPTANGIIRAAAAPKVRPVGDDALWLWGRLHDFERELLRKAPAVVLDTLTPEMLDEVHTLAPRVAAWLNRIGELPWEKTPAA